MDNKTVSLDLDLKLIEGLIRIYVADELGIESQELLDDCIIEYTNEYDLFLALGKSVFNDIVNAILKDGLI